MRTALVTACVDVPMAYLYGRACLWLLLVCKYDLNYIEQIIKGHNGQYAL